MNINPFHNEDYLGFLLFYLCYELTNFIFMITASFWTAEEVDLSKDKDDWASLSVRFETSAQHHIAPYNLTPCSNIQLMRIDEMITKAEQLDV